MGGKKGRNVGAFNLLAREGMTFKAAAALGQAACAATARAVVQSAEGRKACPVSAQRQGAMVMRIL